MTFQIIHTNDLHNHFPDKALKRIHQPGALILDSGDAIAGSNLVYRKREPILRQMREFGYHAMALGNREFHYVRSVMARRFQEAQFPILSANVVDLRKQLNVPDSLMVDVGEIKVGIFGLTVPQYPVASAWEMITGWRFFNPLDVILEIPTRLKKAGASLVICLSHLGFRFDQRLAEHGNDIDVILGGHSHTLLPEVVWQNGIPIVQGGAYGKFVGNWSVSVSFKGEKGRVMKFEGGLVPNDD